MVKFLSGLFDGEKDNYSMVGFHVGNMLSKSNLCLDVYVKSIRIIIFIFIVERIKIQRMDGCVRFLNENDNWVAIEYSTLSV